MQTHMGSGFRATEFLDQVFRIQLEVDESLDQLCATSTTPASKPSVGSSLGFGSFLSAAFDMWKLAMLLNDLQGRCTSAKRIRARSALMLRQVGSFDHAPSELLRVAVVMAVAPCDERQQDADRPPANGVCSIFPRSVGLGPTFPVPGVPSSSPINAFAIAQVKHELVVLGKTRVAKFENQRYSRLSETGHC